ncbi:flavodoxin family protein [Methanoregula sp. UBA64]|uniref:flavodoxin family protein n=1 Tax=Methanoregula sp. UBA64 TaxID=1915554 RepID=UPI0025CD7844|nr:NAD(P)H-dependent oxidoreductase [Methanoregula sp. UBA64]
MKTTIICASYTGTTYGVAEQVRKETGGDLVEVTSRDLLSRFVALMGRHSPGMNVRKSGTEPGQIDLAGSDVVVIGTPVWGGQPVPAIKKAVAGFSGCAGKPVVLFATCGDKPGATLADLAKAVTAKGMVVAGQFSFNKNEIAEGTGVTALIEKVRNTEKSA